MINEKIQKLWPITAIEFDKSSSYTIFGAGNAGKMIASYMIYCVGLTVKFCDNDVSKQNPNLDIPIYSVERAVEEKNSIILVGFIGNNAAKLNSAYECLKEKGVSEEKFLFIDMETEIADITYHREMKSLLDRLGVAKPERIQKVEKICFLSYGFDTVKEKNITGGPIGAICMQKNYLKDNFKGISLVYPYYELERERLYADKFPHITDAILKARRIGRDNHNIIYVANDIFSAFGLYLAGANYLLIFHAQGDMVREMTMWGNKLSKVEADLFYEIEKTTVKHAHKVLFPSKGAEKYFRESFPDNIAFHSGPPLYNTINDYPIIEEVEGLKEDKSCITFLSIGQMTFLKGMDRIPAFIEKYATSSGKKVRWICVANGVLKEQVREQMDHIIQKNSNIEYINIDYKISHGQIFYLMSLCDIYLMLHRVSIFDFSTLEAMYCKKAIILSDIPGNDEFNQEDNILLLEDNYKIKDVESFIHSRLHFGSVNYEVYQKYFSQEPFKIRYYTCLEQFVDEVEKAYV